MARMTIVTLRIARRHLAAVAAALLIVASLIGYAGLLRRSHPAHSRNIPATFIFLGELSADESLDHPPLGAEIGSPAPDFTLHDLEGDTLTLSSFRGRPVLLYFWATWCHHCTRTLPQLTAVHERFQEEGLAVLAINILEHPDKINEYLDHHDMPLTVVLDRDAAVSQTYLIRATPSYMFIDRAGVLTSVHIGAPRPGVIEGHLLSIIPPLPETDPSPEAAAVLGKVHNAVTPEKNRPAGGRRPNPVELPYGS